MDVKPETPAYARQCQYSRPRVDEDLSTILFTHCNVFDANDAI